MSHRFRADLQLLLAAAIWGLAFVAQRLGMEHVGPLTFNAVRFAIGAAVLVPVARARGGRSLAPWRDDLGRGLALGLLLTGGATLQQWGLVFTTAGKAGFITGLYVILVPLLGLLGAQRTRASTWIGAVLAVVGLFLLTMTGRFAMALGDLLVLVGAVFWALHVQLVGRLARRTEPVRLACLQFGVCSVFSALAAVIFEDPQWGGLVGAAGPILYAGLLSTGVAYTLQVVAQRHAPPAHAAIILSLEAVFALVGGMVVLGEALGAREAAGCAVMLTGMLASQAGDLKPRSGRRVGDPEP